MNFPLRIFIKLVFQCTIFVFVHKVYSYLYRYINIYYIMLLINWKSTIGLVLKMKYFRVKISNFRSNFITGTFEKGQKSRLGKYAFYVKQRAIVSPQICLLFRHIFFFGSDVAKIYIFSLSCHTFHFTNNARFAYDSWQK